MANEIKLPIGTIGLSGLYARAIQGTTLGSPISLGEISGAGGVYSGTMTGSAGYYGFLFYDSSDELIGTSTVYYWDGTDFIGLNDVAGGEDSAADIYTYFTDLSREDAFKSDVSGLATPGDIPSADIAEIKSKTDNLPAVPASQGDVTTVGDAIADLPAPLNSTETQTAAAAAIAAANLSTLTGGDIASALTAFPVATPSDLSVTVDGGFGPGAAADLAATLAAAQAAQSASEAVADGRHTINYTASTATQYNADGSPRTTFDLLDAAGNPATSGQTAVDRNPQ